MHWQVFQLLSQMLGGNNLTSLIRQADEKNLWPAILSLSSHQLVTPNLYWALSRDDTIWRSLSDESREYLTSIFELNTLRNEAILAQAGEIITALNKQQIIPLILKNTGELLNHRTPHIGYRLQTDIDLLVQPEQLDDSYAIIKQQGYSIAQEQLGQHGPELHIASTDKVGSLQNEYQHHHHLPPLIKTGATAPIELHRHAYGPRFQHKFPLSNIFQQAECCQQNNLHFLTMSSTQRRQHLIYHSYISDGFQARHEWPLRAACDWISSADQDLRPNSDQQITLFNELVDQVMFNIPAANLRIKHHYFWLKLGLRSSLIAVLLQNFGKLKSRSIKLRHNPQLLRKRWRLWRDS